MVTTVYRDLLRIVWHGPDVPTLKGIELVGAGEESDVVVLDTRAFDDVDGLMRARTEVRAPTLIRCDPEHADEVIARMPLHDDFSLFSEPLGVALQRLRRVHLRYGGARDELTGLITRRQLMHHLERMAAQAGPHRPVSLLMLDIDRFKAINDKYGHVEGDRVLKAIAQRVADSYKAK